MTLLSQIPVSTTPKITDTVVAVANGNQDRLFPLGDIVPAIPATGNMTFYVATTGNDSNPGTIGSPFATIQHALNVAARFDYLGLYTPTIQIADGTYDIGPVSVSTNPIILPPLLNSANFGNITGNPTHPGNVIIRDLGGFGPIWQATEGPLSQWIIGGTTVDEEFFVILIGQGATLQYGDSVQGANHVKDSTGHNFQSLINLNGNGGQLLVNFNLTYDGTNLGQAINTNVGGPASIFWNAGLNCPPGAAWAAQSSVDSNVFVQQQTTSFSNPPTGGGLFLAAFSCFFYRATAPHFFFGDAALQGDPSCFVVNNDQFGAFFANQGSGLPTTSVDGFSTHGTGGLWKDTSGGGVYMAYNDNGTIKKVALT